MSMMEEVDGQLTTAAEKLTHGTQFARSGSKQAKAIQFVCERLFDTIYDFKRTARGLAVEEFIATIAMARDLNGEAAQLLRHTFPGKPGKHNTHLDTALAKSDEAHRSLEVGGRVGSESPLELEGIESRVGAIAGHLAVLLDEIGDMHEEARALSVRLDTSANRSNLAVESITAYREQLGLGQ